MITRTQRTIIVATAVAAIVIAATASDGAYFSQSWGWVALAFLVPSSLLLILDRVSAPGRLRIAFASLMGAFGLWIALSAVWSISASASVREVERMLVYVALALAVALVLRRGDGPAVTAGAFVGVVAMSAYGLATRLFPDRFDSFDDPINTYRLGEPFGYWNATGLFTVIGILLAVGFASHARRAWLALPAAAAIPVLAATLYFTFSRGAWAALFVGLVTTIVVDPRRLRLIWMSLVLSAPAIACVAYASRLDALTTEEALPAAAIREGHRMAWAVGLAMVASVLVAVLGREVSRRLVPSPQVRRGINVALAGLSVAAIAIGLVAAGGPRAAADRFEQRFNAEPVANAHLNKRLFDISGNGRTEQLRVAWNVGRERPLVGQGSGTFEYFWYERRPAVLVVRDAHSLYMETFAELGVVGLALLAGAIVTALIAAIRGRRSRFVAAACGAFSAWIAGSALDWHWEMVALTTTALLIGASGLLAAERRSRGGLLLGTRLALLGVTGTLSVLAVWSLVGNQALFGAREALARKEWADARKDAQRAQALLVWSSEPDIALGDAEAGLGDRQGALRAYRDAVEKDPRNWVAWLRVAQVARGAESDAAYNRVRELNPREKGLPGE